MFAYADTFMDRSGRVVVLFRGRFAIWERLVVVVAPGGAPVGVWHFKWSNPYTLFGESFGSRCSALPRAGRPWYCGASSAYWTARNYLASLGYQAA